MLCLSSMVGVWLWCSFSSSFWNVNFLERARYARITKENVKQKQCCYFVIKTEMFMWYWIQQLLLNCSNAVPLYWYWHWQWKWILHFKWNVDLRWNNFIFYFFFSSHFGFASVSSVSIFHFLRFMSTIKSFENIYSLFLRFEWLTFQLNLIVFFFFIKRTS